MTSKAEIRAAWLAQMLSPTPADRPRAEAGVRRLYTAAGFPEPRHVVWYESPFAASWAVALLAAPYNHLWQESFSSPARSRDDKRRADDTRAALGAQLGLTDWNRVLAAAGAPRGSSLQWPPNPSRMFSSAFLEARHGIVADISELFVVYGDDDDLARAESYFWGGNKGALGSALHCPSTDSIIGQSFVADYPFSSMADDEHRVGDRQPPPILGAAWEIARSAGLWWPFENAAIMSERPVELHVNDRKVLHRADGPAVVYPDGWKVYAWNGKAVPDRWIMEPESVPPRDYKGFDPTFKKHVDSRTAGRPAAKATRKRAKPGSILKAALPADHAARLEQLRAYAGGTLPHLDRYLAGEYQPVWAELVALGAGVREDPYAADALAVAYETMRRVEANVRTLVARLSEMGYTFTTDVGPTTSGSAPPGTARVDLGDLLRSAGAGSKLPPQLGGLFGRMTKALETLAHASKAGKGQPRDRGVRPHVPPAAEVRKSLADFEKDVAAVPLSLRAFYEVVGEVNFVGHHPSLAPRGGAITPDPLVVYGFDEGAVEFDEDDEDDDTPSAITIAPDDLHKADISGGDAYEMAIPDLRADGELLNERHNLFFVDYLRLCFRFGGFPGYEGREQIPPEIETLRADLIAF